MNTGIGALILISSLIILNLLLWEEEKRYKKEVIRGLAYLIVGSILWKAGWKVDPVVVIVLPAITIISWGLMDLIQLDRSSES
ncbi:hypothetical protein [Pyrococcus horikoshii]|uniref:Uncharacterized protein n=1 Tax=Pyrococcus horikoshii TaxID=53953 RepID=A0A832SZ94_PYRHR|nr:hypothetical protein [Pyrococcus horikoshii]HII61322.1 hypothetical protein [Pyrococcus horikoshii]